MLVKEEGPFEAFKKLRELTGIQHFDNGEPGSWGPGNPLTCVLCTSVWVALGLIWMPRKFKEVVAISGIASLIHKVV